MVPAVKYFVCGSFVNTVDPVLMWQLLVYIQDIFYLDLEQPYFKQLHFTRLLSVQVLLLNLLPLTYALVSVLSVDSYSYIIHVAYTVLVRPPCKTGEINH